MGANLQEWEFYVSDRTKTPSNPPDINDDSGVVFVTTVGSADSPSVYSDQNGTALTETNGHAMLSLANGHVRFWTDRSVTNLDISWFGSLTAGMLNNAHFSQHELPGTPNGGEMVAYIPVGNHGMGGGSSVAAETSMGFSMASGVFMNKVWAEVLSAGQNLASAAFDFGILASQTNGDANGFLATKLVSAISHPGGFGVSAVGVLSTGFKFDGTQGLSITPNSESNSAFGALVYMRLQYGKEGRD